ncbi:hypothetical protein [Natronolimnobius baerhuensis]|nr:hypothetical protein [Natronolimnobius baerhuensis]
MLTLVSAMGMGVMGAAAQDNATAPANQSDLEQTAETVDDETLADTLEHQERIALTNQTRIVAWEITGGTAQVALESDMTAWASISDNVAGIGQGGAVHVPETSHQLSRTETTVATMAVESFQGGESVTVTVNGESVRLSTEMDESSDENPLQYFGGESGLFTGMIMAVSMSGAATWFVLWREESGVIRA